MLGLCQRSLGSSADAGFDGLRPKDWRHGIELFLAALQKSPWLSVRFANNRQC